MKKILFTCFVAASVAASAQIFTTQSFEGTTLPTGWTSFSNAGLTSTRSPSYGTSAGPACAGAKAAYVNLYGTTNNNWYLVYTAPAGSSNNTDLNFSFKYLAKAFGTSSPVNGTINFEYSVDNGATWTSALQAPIAITAANGGSIPCTQVSGTIPATSLTGLAANVTPKFRFYAGSATGGDYYQGFDDINFSQTITCPAPTGVTANATGSTTATVSWTAATTAPANGYEIYYSTTNTAPTPTTAPTVTAPAGTTSYNLTGLTANTTYYVYVRSACNGTDRSPYIGPATITTPCAPYNAPYTNDFATVPGACWTRASGGTVQSGPTGTSTYWYADGFLNNGTTGAIKMNIYGSDKVGWLISPTFDLQPTTNSYKVEFDYGLTDYGTVQSSAMGSDDTVQVLMSTNNGTTWTSVQTFNAASNVPAALTHFSYDIPAGTPMNTLKFAIVGSTGTVDDAEDYDFFIDNFAVNQATNLATTEVNGKDKTAEVYPNPFGEQLGIADAKNVKSVEIFDAAGRMVKSVATPGEMISTNDLKSGLYFIKVNHKDGSSSSTKAIKK